LWVITSYFPFDDPFGAKRRLRAYREFRRALQLPLVAVELSLNGSFDLTGRDAEILVQVRDGDLMWQKERLLNLALKALPAHCDTVAWMDCDVVLPRTDWGEAARRALKSARLIQPFTRLYHLSTETMPASGSAPQVSKALDAVAYRFQRGDLPEELFRISGSSIQFGYAPGMVWAASRELLDRYGLYDAAILGAGDKLMFATACGRGADVRKIYRLQNRASEHYQAWGEPFAEAVAGRVASLEGDAYHLWHGDLTFRTGDRFHGFEAFDFDPYADIAPNADGVWQWSSDKPAMHEFVRSFFERRKRGAMTSGAA
jgi:hypothetical protein